MKINLKATSETEMTVDSNKPNANITNIHPNIEEHGHVDVHVKTFFHYPLTVQSIHNYMNEISSAANTF